jgi:hypothetical protein
MFGGGLVGMGEKYVLHLLEPVLEAIRLEVALQLSQTFYIPVEKLERCLARSGVITKPLSRALADSIAKPLLQAGVQVVVVRDNLSEVLLFAETETSEPQFLKEFLADIPFQGARTFVPVTEPSKASRRVVAGVLSLLFLILTLTFGVSFRNVPEPEITVSYQSTR